MSSVSCNANGRSGEVGFDIAGSLHEETTFSIRKGPFKADDGTMHIWAVIEVTFKTADSVMPNLRACVPVAIHDGMSFADIRASAFAGAQALLNHRLVPEAFSAERSAQP